MKVKCHYCGKIFEIKAGYYNRAIKVGCNVYCSKKHSALGRRTNETEQEKKLIKYFYDRLIWLSDDGELRRKKHEAFKKDYAANPEKYRKERQRRMKDHVEYCRQPKYKKYKSGYDKQYRAKKLYDEYWESSVLLCELANIVDNRRAKREQKIYNKSQKRKRNAKAKFKRQKLESCVMGLYQPS